MSADLSRWTPRPRPERRTLEGAIVRLEPLDPARHGDGLFAASTGAGASDRFRYLFEEPPGDRASFDAWLERSAASEDPLFFAVVDKANGRAVGRLTFMRIDAAHGVIETGNILFGPELSRTPGATEAIFLQAAHAFDDLGYRRFEWKCNDANEPSKRAARRFGFTLEGVFHQHMVVKGLNRDTAWFSMLDREWPQRRAAFARFLAADNHDRQGRQLLSLSALNAPELAAGGLTLRRAETDDLQALIALQRAAYTPNEVILGAEALPLRADYASLLREKEVWLAQQAGDLAGALIFEPEPDHLTVWSVATAPGWQGAGLGNALLAAAETRARTLGLETLRLYMGEKLAQNVAWYGRKGYAVERIEPLDDRNLVHMIKRLNG